MRSKAHTTPPAPLVLHLTRIEKYTAKKFIINGQWRNKLFFIVINHFSLVKIKATMNASPVCKLRKNCFTVIDQCANGVKNSSIPSFFNKYIPSAQRIFTTPI
jgi:hypothetical protein